MSFSTLTIHVSMVGSTRLNSKGVIETNYFNPSLQGIESLIYAEQTSNAIYLKMNT